MNDQITRRRVPSGVVFGDSWGYSRAVRCGDRIEISGTSAWAEDGSVMAPNDPYTQTKIVLERIERAVAELGGSMADVIRTRVFLADVADWRDVGRAHREYFGEIEPASTCVGGLALLHPDVKVEVEASAVIASGDEGS